VIVHDFSAMNKDLLLGDFNFITGAKVDVQYLVTQHTYEEHTFEKIMGPENQGFWYEIGSAPISQDLPQTTQEIDKLLKFGAYQAFEEDDIDQILERSVQSANPDVIQTFQKASFSGADNNNTELSLDINDPNFWDKIMPRSNYRDLQPQGQSDQTTHRYNTRSSNNRNK
jgi:hypothetical protein